MSTRDRRIQKIETALNQVGRAWSEEDMLKGDELLQAMISREVGHTLSPGQRRYVGHRWGIVLAECAARGRELPLRQQMKDCR